MEKIEAFGCGFCAKVYREKKVAIAHEKRCYFNPETKSCVTCGSLIGGFDSHCLSGHEIKNNHLRTRCSDHVVSDGSFGDL